MTTKQWTFLILTVFAVVGAVMAVYGVVAAVALDQSAWHTPVLVGGTVFAAYLVYLTDRAGLLWDLVISPVRVPLQYAIYVGIGVVIELIGQHMLGWWSYPAFSPMLEVVHVGLIGYPFLFFLLFELYVLLHWLSRRVWFSLVAAWLVSIVVNEFPNWVAQQWIYDIPVIPGWEVLGLHVFVIVGWIIPLVIPLFVRGALGLPTYTTAPE